MRTRWLVALGVAVVAIGLIAWSFYATVLAPPGDGQVAEGQVAEGMVMAGDPAQNTAPAADAFAGIGGAGADVLPPLLGGFHVTALQSGSAALASVERLHGKPLGAGLDAAWVAQYGNSGEATLWVSRSANESDARVLFDRMTTKIGEGNSPFSGLAPMADRALDSRTLDGYELDGMGQKHFYFLAGTDLYWLAARPDLAESALADLTHSVTSNLAPATVN